MKVTNLWRFFRLHISLSGPSLLQERKDRGYHAMARSVQAPNLIRHYLGRRFIAGFIPTT